MVYSEKGDNRENIFSHERFPNYVVANHLQELYTLKDELQIFLLQDNMFEICWPFFCHDKAVKIF